MYADGEKAHYKASAVLLLEVHRHETINRRSKRVNLLQWYSFFLQGIDSGGGYIGIRGNMLPFLPEFTREFEIRVEAHNSGCMLYALRHGTQRHCCLTYEQECPEQGCRHQ